MEIEKDLWYLQVRLVVFSQFIIILALDMSDPYWPLILSSFHLFNPRSLQYWSGAIYMAPLLTTILTTLLWTKIGEFIGYKKMILRAGFALAATQWGLFFFANPWAIFTIRLIQGGLAGFTAAAQAWSLSITPTNTHSQIVGRLQAATAMGSIVGPICGGIISHYYGYLSIFISAGCVCLLLSFVLANFLKENPLQSIRASVSSRQKRFFLDEGKQNLLLLLICSTQAARWMSAPFFALYVAEQLHADNLTLGFIYATMALTMSLTTSILGRIIDNKPGQYGGIGLLIVALLLSGLAQWGFAFISKSYLAFAVSLFWGISLGIISLLLFSFLLKGIGDESRAKAVGLGNTALKLGNLIGIMMGTLIQAEGHFMLSFAVIGGVYFFLAILAGCYK
ncbi:transporter major facilitator family [Candidatus Rickettsiella viridis]|uniref:Transporter major facilitator family n=1 Tax=Candidatus Rickettsiella viridis TaxID=676208 RepID=A0A2Z5UUX7_9COXI|nr:MFS transporter [Candidatus Rickettsiella viridis]BBB14753.1 transporter major facilitator family [Candidatus Rickettsiella viridis]